MRSIKIHASTIATLALGTLAVIGCDEAAAPPPSPAAETAKAEAPKVASAPETATAAPAAATAAVAADAAPYVRIESKDIDAKQRQAAETFAGNYMATRKAGQYAELGDDVTAAMKEALTVDKQKQSNEVMTAMFGEYKSLEFVEAWKTTGEPSLNIYRFRGTFAKEDKPEVRVILDKDGKVAGFWARPWQDDLTATPKLTKIEADQVNATQKAAAEKLATTYLENGKAGRFVKLGDEATPTVQAALSPETQKAAQAQFASLFGEYQSLAYVEALKDEASKTTTYRFRGTFSKDKPEVRVTLDEAGKLAGLWLKPWQDELK